MSTHNICFCGEIRKILTDTHPYLDLWRIKVYTVCQRSSNLRIYQQVVKGVCSSYTTSMVKSWSVQILTINKIFYMSQDKFFTLHQGGRNTMPDFVQLVPFLWGQVRNYKLLVLGQGLHRSSEEEYPDYNICIFHISYFSYFLKKTCCGYSLEAPHWGASNEYPQHMVSLIN